MDVVTLVVAIGDVASRRGRGETGSGRRETYGEGLTHEMAHLEDARHCWQGRSGDSPRTNTGLIARSRVGGNGLANAGQQEWGKPGRGEGEGES